MRLDTDVLPITAASRITHTQKKVFGPVKYRENGTNYQISAEVRWDDECRNGHNSFAVTGTIYLCDVSHNPVRWDSGGCLHEEIAKYFPELAHVIKWHLCSSDGPMHYVANTVYHASERDCHGLLKGEVRQLRNGKTGQLAWKLEADRELPKYVDADEQPSEVATLRYVPWNRIGEGKARELDFARASAAWPEATDEELTAPGLEQRLLARLPEMLERMRADIEALGFTW
jgi:hypothetical protein